MSNHTTDASTAARSTAAPARRHRPPRTQAVLEVVEKSRVTPNLLRVVLGGEGLKNLNENTSTDHYVKLLLPDPSAGLTPPYDMDDLRAHHPEILPRMRTYTIRWWDTSTGRIALDFVLHSEGDGKIGGVAAVWADEVLPGETIAMTGAGGNYSPDPGAGYHLFIGDHSALPAITSALQALPGDARGTALVQLDHAEDIQEIDTPEGVDLEWILEPLDALYEHVAALQIPEDVDIFAHGERGVIKQIRRNLVRERGIDKSRISISAYWALGRIEDQFQAEKREPIGKIDED